MICLPHLRDAAVVLLSSLVRSGPAPSMSSSSTCLSSSITKQQYPRRFFLTVFHRTTATTTSALAATTTSMAATSTTTTESRAQPPPPPLPRRFLYFHLYIENQRVTKNESRPVFLRLPPPPPPQVDDAQQQQKLLLPSTNIKTTASTNNDHDTVATSYYNSTTTTTTIRHVQSYIKHQLRLHELSQYPSHDLYIYPFGSTTWMAMSSKATTNTQQQKQHIPPPFSTTFAAVMIPPDDVWDPYIHGGATLQTPLVVHATQQQKSLRSHTTTTNHHHKKKKSLREQQQDRQQQDVWIQLYTDMAPLGPPLTIPVPLTTPINITTTTMSSSIATRNTLNDDTNHSTTNSSNTVRYVSLIWDLQRAVKATYKDLLVGTTLSMLKVYPHDALAIQEQNANIVDIIEPPQVNHVLTPYSYYQPHIHGGIQESRPLYIFVDPKPPLRTTQPEQDPKDEEWWKQNRSLHIEQAVVGPMELRLPIFAKFAARIHNRHHTADMGADVPSLVQEYLHQLLSNKQTNQQVHSIDENKFFVTCTRTFLERLLDQTLDEVDFESPIYHGDTDDDDDDDEIREVDNMNRHKQQDASTARLLYRDSDMVVNLEVWNGFDSLDEEFSLQEETTKLYHRIKYADMDGCCYCPHAAITVVLVPNQHMIGVYGTLVNHTLMTHQQWLTPFYSLKPSSSPSKTVSGGEREESQQLTEPDSVIVNLWTAIQECVRELREAVQSSLLSTIPDLPDLNELIDLDEYLTLNYPMGRGKLLYHGKYGQQEVVVKFCRNYCIEAHRLLAQERLSPKVYWYGEIAGWKVVIMKYYKKGRARLKLKEKQVAACESVLARLHQHGYVHGDARSRNFVWSDNRTNREPLLIDFDHSGRISETYYPHSRMTEDEVETIIENGGKYYPAGTLVEPDHDFDILSTRR